MRIIRVTVLLVLLLFTLSVYAEHIDNSPDYTDDAAYSNFAGRLHIPEVGIDVALYRSNKQYVVDRKDSAAYFDLPRWRGHMSVADHWTQAFGPLRDVTVGMEAYIVHKDGTITYYTCVDLFDGRNTGHGITDGNGRFVHNKAPLLMYTCIDGPKNVRVVLWEPVTDTEMEGAS